MRIREAGQVLDCLWHLGDEESGIYLLEGTEESLIISGGMSHIIPAVLHQVESFGIDEGKIKKLLILHAHFDHIGVVPFFKRRYPDLQVYASRRAWEILASEKARETINQFSRLTNARLGVADDLSDFDFEWRDDVSGITVKDGDIIDLDTVQVSIIEIPGHSSCSIAAYVPQMKVLFPSDGGGIPHRDEIIPAGNSNYTQFQHSLEKMKGLQVEYLCADHGGFVTGGEARHFISETIGVAREFRRLIESVYRRTGDMNATVQHLVDLRMKREPDYVISEEILAGVYGQIVRHIATVMEDTQ